jgi:hypothetical protein
MALEISHSDGRVELEDNLCIERSPLFNHAARVSAAKPKSGLLMAPLYRADPLQRSDPVAVSTLRTDTVSP